MVLIYKKCIFIVKSLTLIKKYLLGREEEYCNEFVKNSLSLNLSFFDFIKSNFVRSYVGEI